MIPELFTALFKAGLPVFAVSYLLVWWALRNGFLANVQTVKEVAAEVKRQRKDKERKMDSDRVHRKWLSLGGGFYGVVALVTLGYIELADIAGFLSGFQGVGAFLDSLFSVSFLVGLFIETLTNTITALAWPAYWLSDVRSDYVWIWFIVAYGSYWLGSDLATRRFREQGKPDA